MVCRLVMLIKNPGVRPIDTGQGLGRIMGKVVMIIFKKDTIMYKLVVKSVTL